MKEVPTDIPDGIDPLSYFKDIPDEDFSLYTLNGCRIYAPRVRPHG